MLLNFGARKDSWVPWTARSSNLPILKEINPEYSLEALMLKLKLQYFWSLDAKSQLFGKDPHAGKDWRKMRRWRQRIRWLYCNTNSMGISLIDLQEIVTDREAWHAGNHGVTKSWTQLSNWKATTFSLNCVWKIGHV